MSTKREYFAVGSPTTEIDSERLVELLEGLVAELGPMKRVLLLPPDFTRFHSGAGEITAWLYQRLCREAEVWMLPAIGTHVPVSALQLDRMFPGVPHDRVIAHDWRNGLVRLGVVEGSRIEELSGGRLRYEVPCEINRTLVEGRWDRILSIGQLVPHEVIGIANHNKNVFVGTGGKPTIDRSHYLGAVCGMESVMGRARSPVRAVLDDMSVRFADHLPLTYVLTVRARNDEGRLVTRGLYAGDGFECFNAGARLVQQVNLDLLDRPIRTAVVWLDPDEFHTTWLGNKAVYRTRMAMADGGRLIVLAPGVKAFGEDKGIDALIRRFGYKGTPHTLDLVERHAELAANLSAPAHLIHGSSEGRFEIVYAPGGLTREEVEGVGYQYADLGEMLQRYAPGSLRHGWNTMPDGEEVFFVENPALGLWGLREHFAR